MARRRSPKYSPKKARRSSITTDRKAKSIQSCWRKATEGIMDPRARALPIADARALVAKPPTCPYCLVQIPWRLISIDHIMPKSRGGSNEPENLVFADLECNLAKGNLTGEEFTLLMEFLNQHPTLKARVIPRLVASGSLFSRKRGRKR